MIDGMNNLGDIASRKSQNLPIWLGDILAKLVGTMTMGDLWVITHKPAFRRGIGGETTDSGICLRHSLDG